MVGAQINSGKASTLVAELAKKIRQEIEKSNLKKGDFFMTEDALGKKYGISRNVVREAVSCLRGLGVLESRKRKGLIVCSPDPVKLLSTGLSAMTHSQDGIAELIRLRYVIEIGAMELVIQNSDSEQIFQLERYARQFAEAVQRGCTDEEENEIEIAFHSMILSMTGSALIAQLQEVLTQYFQVAAPKEDKSEVRSEENIWQHKELVNAIREKDLAKAQTMIRLHYKRLLTSQEKKPN